MENEMIRCSTFLLAEETITRLTSEIRNTKDMDEKIRKAQSLLEESNSLLSCIEYDEHSVECRSCHTLSSLRKKIAEILLRVESLSERKSKTPKWR